MRETILLAICLVIAIPAGDTSIGSARAEVVAAVTQRPCFGAAARDPQAPCVDPSLQKTVFPTPDDALLEPNAECTPFGRSKLLFPCRFGASRPATADTVALVGDSHATHWRGAVDVVAKAHDWPAVSITRSGCPFSDAQAILPRDATEECRRWNRELLRWLGDHRDVTTLFVSHRAKASYVRKRGVSSFETAVRGYMSRWSKLPSRIRTIFVIRDTPRGSGSSSACVRKAIRLRQSAARLCARARGRALRRDPAVTAAERLGSPRLKIIDLTRFFCDSLRCYPVVGGALVHKDNTHITAIFARTLGRYMLAIVDDLRAHVTLPSFVSLLPDERALGECLLEERDLALRAGGWGNIGGEHLVRAKDCRERLEQRAAQIKAAGLTGTFNRAGRYRAIQQVLAVR